MGIPQDRWFIMENPWGYFPFQETSRWWRFGCSSHKSSLMLANRDICLAAPVGSTRSDAHRIPQLVFLFKSETNKQILYISTCNYYISTYFTVGHSISKIFHSGFVLVPSLVRFTKTTGFRGGPSPWRPWHADAKPPGETGEAYQPALAKGGWTVEFMSCCTPWTKKVWDPHHFKLTEDLNGGLSIWKLKKKAMENPHDKDMGSRGRGFWRFLHGPVSSSFHRSFPSERPRPTL